MVDAGERSSNETSGESEGALIAKRKTNAGRLAKGKPKHYKRETNAQRTAREDKRRNALELSEMVARTIRDRMANKADLEKRIFLPKSKRWLKTYRYLGLLLCEYSKNLPRVLRLVADRLEGKPLPYSPGNDWYDAAITKAYEEADRRYTYPHFAEFLDIFWEQNPKSKLPRPPSERSLRRSLRRLGCLICPVKPGRPNAAIKKAYETATIRYKYPTFAEFLDIFWEQNPKSQAASARSLQKSLGRFGYCTWAPHKLEGAKEK